MLQVVLSSILDMMMINGGDSSLTTLMNHYCCWVIKAMNCHCFPSWTHDCKQHYYGALVEEHKEKNLELWKENYIENAQGKKHMITLGLMKELFVTFVLRFYFL